MSWLVWLILFGMVWTICGGVTLWGMAQYAIHFKQEEMDEITLDMLPMMFVLGLIWPITIGMTLHDWYENHGDMVLWKNEPEPEPELQDELNYSEDTEYY